MLLNKLFVKGTLFFRPRDDALSPEGRVSFVSGSMGFRQRDDNIFVTGTIGKSAQGKDLGITWWQVERERGLR
jgi:hypothetical protein